MPGPCPECGSVKLRQRTVQWEDVTVDRNGDIRDISYQDSLEITEIECDDCGHELEADD